MLPVPFVHHSLSPLNKEVVHKALKQPFQFENYLLTADFCQATEDCSQKLQVLKKTNHRYERPKIVTGTRFSAKNPFANFKHRRANVLTVVQF